MIRDSDIGRPVGELASNLKYDKLWDDCRGVLKTLVALENEVRSNDGRWHMMKILPYRTSENVIDGLVLTFIDISQLMAGREALAFSRSVIDTVREPLLILDEDLRVVVANQSFYRSFRTTGNKSQGELFYELGNAQWNVPELRKLLLEIIPQKSTFNNFEVTAEFPKLGSRTFVLNARQLDRESGLPKMILLAMEEQVK